MSYRCKRDDDAKGYSSSSSSGTSSPSPRRSFQRSSSSKSGSSRSRSRSRSRSKSPNKKTGRHGHRRDEYRHRSAGREAEKHPVDRLQQRPENSPSDRSQDSSRSDKSSKEAKSTSDGNVSRVVGDDDSIPKTPPPPRISKTAIQFGKPGTVARPGIHIKLAPTKPKCESTKKITVASAFNNDSDEEVEEMPPECKMRMRNIGRDTPTSSGPNSFGKTKQGFIDSKKLFEKSLREAAME